MISSGPMPSEILVEPRRSENHRAALMRSVTPPRLLGRVSAINILSYGARPLGSAIGALVGGLYGAEACLYLAVAIFGAQALVILLSPAVALARQPEMVGDGPVARPC